MSDTIQRLVDPTDPALDGPIILPEAPTGNVTPESEIKAMWRHAMLGAADDARRLVTQPIWTRGTVFESMRTRLKMAEGSCRQMCHWREDARWLYLAPMLEKTHQMAGEMLRNRHYGTLFLKLEETLRKLVHDADRLENAATGRLGAILPEPARIDRTEGRPIQVLAS